MIGTLNRQTIGVATAMALVTLVSSTAGAVPLVSDGSDGAFNPIVSQVIDLDAIAPDGIFNFTDITIPAGVTYPLAS